MPTGREILDLVMDPKSNDAQASTIDEYLGQLLLKLWNEQEGFSGKRPFGNSSWCYDLYKPLIEAGFIEGEIDPDGYLQSCDNDAGEIMIRTAILEAFGMEEVEVDGDGDDDDQEEDE